MKRREQIFWIFDAAHERCSISHFLTIRTGKLSCRTQHSESRDDVRQQEEMGGGANLNDLWLAEVERGRDEGQQDNVTGQGQVRGLCDDHFCLKNTCFYMTGQTRYKEREKKLRKMEADKVSESGWYRCLQERMRFCNNSTLSVSHPDLNPKGFIGSYVLVSILLGVC